MELMTASPVPCCAQISTPPASVWLSKWGGEEKGARAAPGARVWKCRGRGRMHGPSWHMALVGAEAAN